MYAVIITVKEEETEEAILNRKSLKHGSLINIAVDTIKNALENLKKQYIKQIVKHFNSGSCL